jgi:hypothetical protein
MANRNEKNVATYLFFALGLPEQILDMLVQILLLGEHGCVARTYNNAAEKLQNVDTFARFSMLMPHRKTASGNQTQVCQQNFAFCELWKSPLIKDLEI